MSLGFFLGSLNHKAFQHEIKQLTLLMSGRQVVKIAIRGLAVACPLQGLVRFSPLKFSVISELLQLVSRQMPHPVELRSEAQRAACQNFDY